MGEEIMSEITSLTGKGINIMPTLPKKRAQQADLGNIGTQPQRSASASGPLWQPPTGDSVHFLGNKRRRTDDDDSGRPAARPRHNNAPDPENGPDSSTEGGSEDSDNELFPQPGGGRRDTISFLPFLFGGENELNRPVIDPGLLMREHIKPLEEKDGDDAWKAYKHPAASYGQTLAEITSRPFLNNAVLHADDDKMKKAILMKLKEQSPDKHLFAVDCAPKNLAKLKGHYKGAPLPHLFSEPAQTLGLPSPSSKPTVLLLNNASVADAESLQRNDAFERIKDRNPHYRFVIAQPHPPSESESSHPLAAMLKGLEARFKPDETQRAPFESVTVGPLSTTQWVQVMRQDQRARQILDHYKLTFSPKKMDAFLNKLQQSQDAPLSRVKILGEIDSLASFIRMQKHDQSPKVSDQHIAEYTRHLQPESPKATAKPNSSDSGGMSSDPLEQKPYKLVKASDITTRLNDVVGHDHAKGVLSQALEAIKYPKFYKHINQGDKDASNNNVLLMGEPGGGKSMLAEAIAGEGKGTFISTTGSQFVNVYVGMGANNMRQLKAAIEQAPDNLVVVFIDEIDSLGNRSNKGPLDGGGNREETQTINEFLAMTEGVNSKNHNKQVLLIGATNHPDSLDTGILSRFHYKETIGKLNGAQRRLLMEKQLKEKKLDTDKSVDIDALVKQTEGLSGRDLRNVMKLAKQSLLRQLPQSEKERLNDDAKALKDFRLKVTQDDLETALKEVKAGWKGVNPDKIERNEDSLSHLYL
jgi:SpoVK/Ycf46/Vps4 family AAA+-type ATPase